MACAVLVAWIACLCVAPAAAGAPSPPRLRALVVGLSHYRTSCWETLQGTRDAALFRDALVSRFHASPSDVTLIPEQEGTSEGIRQGLSRLVAQAAPGDTVVFYYAGHGGVVLDETGDDPDGLNECLVPIDAPSYEDPAYAARVIRDKDIEAILARLVTRVREGGRMGSVVFVFDSCHAGGISRGARGRGRRLRTNPAVLDYFLTRAHERLAAARCPPRRIRGHAAGERGWVVLAACRADQGAADEPRSFTQVLVRALADGRLGPGSDYYDLMQIVVADCLADPDIRDSQAPQCEGEPSLPLLGGTAEPRTPAIHVTAARREEEGVFLTLDKGTVLGITPGTRLAVFRFGARSRRDAALALGDAVVESADAYTAEARFTGSRAPSAGALQKCRLAFGEAFDNAGTCTSDVRLTGGAMPSPGDLRNAVAWVTHLDLSGREIRLFVDPRLGREGPASALRRGISESLAGLVRQVPTVDGADLLLVCGESAGAVSLERPVVAAVRSQVFTGALADPRTPGEMCAAIRGEARRLALGRMAMGEGDVEARLVPGKFATASVDSFEPEGGNAEEARHRHLAQGGLLSFHSGDQALLEIVNRGTRPLFVSVLDLAPSGALEVLYPLAGERATYKSVHPGDTLRIDVVFRFTGRDRQPGESLEGFSVLGTTRPIDLVYLATRGTKQTTEDPEVSLQGGLGSAMQTLMGGPERRGALTEPAGPKGIDCSEAVLLPPLWVRLLPRGGEPR